MSKILLRATSGGSVSLQGEDSAVDTVVTIPSGDVTMATTDDVIGVGQTWQDVSGSRAVNTDYTNDTGKPIQVSIMGYAASNSSSYLRLLVGGVSVDLAGQRGATDADSDYVQVGTIVPVGAVYRVEDNSGAVMTSWVELR